MQQAGDDRPADAEHVAVQLYRPIASSATSPTRPPFIKILDFGGSLGAFDAQGDKDLDICGANN